MDQTQPSRLGSLVLQGFVQSIAATVMSSAVVGSLILQGNLITTSQNNSAPSLVYDSGSYLTYQEARLTASGSRNLVGNIQLSTAFASGGVLQAASVECNKIGKVASRSIVIQSGTKQSATTGFPVQHRVRIATGSVALVSSGHLIAKINDDHYVNFIGTSSGGLAYIESADCRLKAWTHAKYGR